MRTPCSKLYAVTHNQDSLSLKAHAANYDTEIIDRKICQQQRFSLRCICKPRIVIGCLHDPANVQQTSSKCNAGRLLDRVNTVKHPITDLWNLTNTKQIFRARGAAMPLLILLCYVEMCC